MNEITHVPIDASGTIKLNPEPLAEDDTLGQGPPEKDYEEILSILLAQYVDVPWERIATEINGRRILAPDDETHLKIIAGVLAKAIQRLNER